MRDFIIGLAFVTAGAAAIARADVELQPSDRPSGAPLPPLAPPPTTSPLTPITTPNTPTAPTTPDAATKVEEGVIELIGQGDEKGRRVLRMTPGTATKFRYHVSTTRKLERGQLGGTWRPLLTQDFGADMKISTERGTAEREGRTKVSVFNVSASTTAGVDTEFLRKSLSDSMAAIVENLTLSGVALGKDDNAPANGKVPDRAMTDGLSEVLSNAMIPLPAEPVAIGASWRVTTTETKAGLSIPTTSTYTISEMRDDRIVLQVNISENLREQMVADAKASGGSVRISYSSNAVGSAVLSLDSPISAVSLEIVGTVEVTGKDLQGRSLDSLMFNVISSIKPGAETGASEPKAPAINDGPGDDMRISLPLLPNSKSGKSKSKPRPR